MIYYLFILIAILFLISYYFCGKDFFAPSTMQLLTFVVSIFMCLYFMWSMDCFHQFHGETVGMILIAMTMSMVFGIIIHRMVLKIRVHPHTPTTVTISPISNRVSILFLFINIITILWLLFEIRRIGGSAGSFFEIMYRFRRLNSFSVEEEGRLPWLLNQLISLTNILVMLYGFNLLRFYKSLSVWSKWSSFLIICFSVLISLLTAMRTPVINNLIGCIIIYHLLRIQKEGSYQPYKIKALLRMAAILFVTLVAFFLVKNFVGRTTQSEMTNVADYISYYIGSGYIAFDKYLQEPPAPSNIFGKETFLGMITFLIQYRFIDIPPYVGHLEFRSVGGGFQNNVYTFLRVYHYDFGLMSTFILHGLSIAFLSVFYEYVKKKRSNMGILIFGIMYYSVVLSFFTERFFSNVVSVSFLKKVFMLIILYELTIRKRIRVTFGKRATKSRMLPKRVNRY